MPPVLEKIVGACREFLPAAIAVKATTAKKKHDQNDN
jgi:hypothetical protein